MSLLHKACLFADEAFHDELGEILYAALEAGDPEPIRAFCKSRRRRIDEAGIKADLATLAATDGVTPERLALLEVQRVAEVAIKPYCDAADHGLDTGWDALARYCLTVPTLAPRADELIFGQPFGPPGKRLDPGAMGTGITSARRARVLAGMLAAHQPRPPSPNSEVYATCHYKPESARAVVDSYRALSALYQAAVAADRGILFRDFDERGMIDR